MKGTTLFDEQYESRKRPLLKQIVEHLRPIYTEEELDAFRIDSISRGILSQRSGRGFVNRDILETILGNLLECVAPGSHNAIESPQSPGLSDSIEELADQLYAMVFQSHLAARGDDGDIDTIALNTTFSLLCQLPRLKERALWNRFASLKDPAVWDAHIFHQGGLDPDSLVDLDAFTQIDLAIEQREFDHYREYLKSRSLDFAFDYQMQLVVSTYPGWRVLFYHDISHELTRTDSDGSLSNVKRIPVPLLPRAISELGGRYYQADLHPESHIGDANFLEHPHRGLTTGQTGVIGHGCVIYPCTLGGLSDKVRQRHPTLGNFVKIGTDATLLGPVNIGNGSTVGSGSDIYGLVEAGNNCQIASSVVIGTVRTGGKMPGTIRMGSEVRVNDGCVIENSTELDLVIPDKSDIPARSHVINDGFGNPRFVHE